MKQQRDKYLQQLTELAKSKPKDKNEEGMLQSLARLEVELTSATDDLVRVDWELAMLTLQSATRLRLNGLRKEIDGLQKDLQKLKPERQKRAKALSDSEKKKETLAAVVNGADDNIFDAFCKRIKVANIREYEDVQLKVAQEENEAMEEYAAQNARISHQ